jgi:hypothetical protein
VAVAGRLRERASLQLHTAVVPIIETHWFSIDRINSSFYNGPATTPGCEQRTLFSFQETAKLCVRIQVLCVHLRTRITPRFVSNPRDLDHPRPRLLSYTHRRFTEFRRPWT